jgi:hypothetical protein
MEYAYLKLISIFNINNNIGKYDYFCLFSNLFGINLECIRLYDQIDAYRILTYKELHDYLNDQYVSTSHDECRLGRLLLKLSSLTEFDRSIIEEIFFVGLIGMLLFFFFFFELFSFFCLF